jgi:hypothetical protein
LQQTGVDESGDTADDFTSEIIPVPDGCFGGFQSEATREDR